MTRMFKAASLTLAMALTGAGAFSTAAAAAEEKTVMVGGAPSTRRDDRRECGQLEGPRPPWSPP